MFCHCTAQLAVGRALGRLAYRFSRRDRRIASINIALCLPGLSAQERDELVREHFESLGCTLIETGLVWWARDARLRKLIQFEGEEHLRRRTGQGPWRADAERALHQLGNGCACVDAARTDQRHRYLTPGNPLIAELTRRNRERHTVQAVTSEQIRELLTNLKNNLPVWYAPDQRYTGKNSEIVPFFGVPAAVQRRHLTTSEDLGRTGATLLFPERRADEFRLS